MKPRSFFLPLRRLFLLAPALLCLAACGAKSRETDLRGRVKKIVLDNGMTFLLAPRDVAPVTAIQLKVRVGNVEEDPDMTGLAHFFEHMAFKGTDKIGTRDYAAEKPILDEVLRVGSEIAAMKKAGRPPEDYAPLVEKRKALEAEQNKVLEKNEFMSVYQRNGGKDINASTSNDFTTYYVSLPSSKLELWAYLESERLSNRVFREFFTEVDVVAEERRMRIDSSPDGRLYEAYIGLGFDKSPYQIHPIGRTEHIQQYTPERARAFYERYYVPSRMVVAIAGAFDVAEVEAIVREYFSKLPKGEDRPKEIPEEIPDSSYPRQTAIEDDARPRFYFGYHRPPHPHPDDIVLDVVQDLLCGGRAARLYKKLVLEDRSVSHVNCFASIPGARLGGLFTFTAGPLAPHTNAGIQETIRGELRKLAEEGPSDKELQIVKNRTDADLIYGMQSNSGLAGNLAFYESLTGDWRYMYERQERVHKVTADDVKRVIKAYFTPSREVSAYLEQKK